MRSRIIIIPNRRILRRNHQLLCNPPDAADPYYGARVTIVIEVEYPEEPNRRGAGLKITVVAGITLKFLWEGGSNKWEVGRGQSADVPLFTRLIIIYYII